VDERAKDMCIKVTADGPYIVTGGVPLVRTEIVCDENGEALEWREIARIDAADRYTLCRCGHSTRKPFCDGSHLDMRFDGTETAGHDSYAEVAVDIDGPGVKLRDARRLCAEARFCARGGGLWNLVSECEDAEKRELAEQEATLCPSGRYVLCDDSGTGEREPDLEASIALVEDPALGVSGPLWVRGGIPVVDADGVPYEVRNRVTLCRCGHSGNKPFCDGSHIGAGFEDEEASR
jgi:CDGSH-type Zn-finger protein